MAFAGAPVAQFFQGGLAPSPCSSERMWSFLPGQMAQARELAPKDGLDLYFRCLAVFGIVHSG
jgi:hypothetical protein